MITRWLVTWPSRRGGGLSGWARGGEPDLLRKGGDRLSHEFLTAALADRQARRCGPVRGGR